MGDGRAMKPGLPHTLAALPSGEIGERPCDGVFIAKLVTHHYQGPGAVVMKSPRRLGVYLCPKRPASHLPTTVLRQFRMHACAFMYVETWENSLLQYLHVVIV